MRGLFLLHEGVPSSIFESQVLLHCEECYRCGVNFDILTYELFSKSWQKSVENKARFEKEGYSVTIFLKKGLIQYFPLASIINSLLFIVFILRNRSKYHFIHARSDYTALIALLTRPFHRLPVVWDCRGDSQDELIFAFERKSRILAWTLGTYNRIANFFVLRLLIRWADSAIFVSKELKSLYLNRGWASSDIVVPCVVSPSRFYYDERLRLKYRKLLNASDDCVVYLYTGSMVPYQGINYIKQYINSLNSDDTNAILLVLTRDIEAASNFFSSLSNCIVQIKSVGHRDVNSYCNAADYALLFRDARSLNFVASPTKHGEYRMAGLPVISNGTVAQVKEFDVCLESLSCSFFSNESNANLNLRSLISLCANERFSRDIYIHRYIDLYSNLYGRLS